MGKDTQKSNGVTREFSSGGIVFKNNKWLITASNPSKEYPKVVWRFPKGQINEGEDLKKTALREVEEEGGVKAEIVEKIGTEKYFFTSHQGEKIFKFVTFFLMKWINDLPEGFGEETSETVWLSYEDAYKKLSYGGEKQLLKKALSVVEGPP